MPVLETAQPYMPEEGYEVAMKPEYAQYREKLPSTKFGRFAADIQNIPARLSSLRDINKYYSGGAEEYLATNPHPLVQYQYEQILKDYKWSPFKSIMINNLAIETNLEDKESIEFWKKHHPELFARLKPEFELLDAALIEGKKNYAEVQRTKRFKLADLWYDITYGQTK
jgi:hypothetical protein